ncbi:MAG: ASCH domain-containing protein [Thermoplasmata archaeon]
MQELVGGRAIVLAIHPEYAARIYSGEKTAELRRAAPASPVRIAFIYETAPESAITGVMLVDGVSRTSPARAWRQFSRRICISEQEFYEYLNGCRAATVYEVSRPFKFPRRVLLVKTTHLRRPPQSYSYLDRAVTSNVLRSGVPPPIVPETHQGHTYMCQATLREWEGRLSFLEGLGPAGIA